MRIVLVRPTLSKIGFLRATQFRLTWLPIDVIYFTRFFLICLTSFLINTQLIAHTLVIGTVTYDPPLESVFDKKGDLVGFEIELMDEICKRLQETCTYQLMSFKQILSDIRMGAIDLAIAGITINEERKLTYLFSLPYLESKAQLIAGRSAINKLSDVEGKRLGVEIDSVFQAMAKDKFKSITLVEYETQNQLYQALANGEVDSIVLDQTSAQYWVANNGMLFKLVGDGIALGEGFGIIANIKSTELINRINNILITMENDGTYVAIYQKYF